jgi:hypothetical protein
MIEVSSRRASDAEGYVTTGGWFVRLLSDHRIRVAVAAAALMLAGGFTISRSAYAQDATNCVEKCTTDEKQCLHDGASEEMCDYDKKQCQKTCGESK